MEGDSSAHPLAENYDPTFAQQVSGDLAEEVRQWLADKHDARPPGLQTISKEDGSIEVIADCPDAGIGLKIRVEPLGQQQSQMPGVGPDMGEGLPPDAGIGPDMGPEPDMGVGPDMGSPDMGGLPPDAGMGPDMGAAPMGAPDMGAAPPPQGNPPVGVGPM
jgi:hypothetical protein